MTSVSEAARIEVVIKSTLCLVSNSHWQYCPVKADGQAHLVLFSVEQEPPCKQGA